VPRRRATQILSAVCAALVVALAVVAGSPAGRSTDEAASRWQPIASLDHSAHGNRLTAGAWAAGRAWFVLSSIRGITVTSARPRQGTLASLQTTRITTPLAWYPLVVGAGLAYNTTKSSSGLAPFLTSGKVGAPDAPSPEPLTPNKGIPVAAVRVEDRIVWALAGGVPFGGSGAYRMKLSLCCDEAGGVVDLTSRTGIRPSPRPGDMTLGVDAKRRLWLAWGDKDGTQMIELDVDTLEPRARKPAVAPMRGGYSVKLVCARTCRTVATGSERKPTGGSAQFIATWAPGERTVTRIALPPAADGSHQHPILVAAGYRGDRLAVAYRQDSDNRSTLKVVAGDERGRRARLAGSVDLPRLYSGLPMWIGSAAAFTPSGFAFAQPYSGGSKARVIATLVPLR
jgi:hypothetical protein